jgi:hypothetical protein
MESNDPFKTLTYRWHLTSLILQSLTLHSLKEVEELGGLKKEES